MYIDSDEFRGRYFTVFANALDNFSHGVAVAAAFSLNVKVPRFLIGRDALVTLMQVGLTTTAAIALHEIPHEVRRHAIINHSRQCRDACVQLGDFAILVRSGLNKDRAIAIQCFTSSFMYVTRIPCGCDPAHCVAGRSVPSAASCSKAWSASLYRCWLLPPAALCTLRWCRWARIC